jgi:hypothetical protein
MFQIWRLCDGAAMPDSEWFEALDDDDLDASQRAFLAALRERARAWPCEPRDTLLARPAHGERDGWVAALDVIAGVENTILLTVGARFDGVSIRCGEVHNQLFFLVPAARSKVRVLAASGDPDHLASAASDWFDEVLARPVERREWVLAHGRVGVAYAFSDTGRGLGGEAVALDEARVRPPDRIVHARGTRVSGAAIGHPAS